MRAGDARRWKAEDSAKRVAGRRSLGDEINREPVVRVGGLCGNQNEEQREVGV